MIASADIQNTANNANTLLATLLLQSQLNALNNNNNVIAQPLMNNVASLTQPDSNIKIPRPLNKGTTSAFSPVSKRNYEGSTSDCLSLESPKSQENNNEVHESSEGIENYGLFVKSLVQMSQKYNNDWKKVAKALQSILNKHITPMQVKQKVSAIPFDLFKTANATTTVTATTSSPKAPKVLAPSGNMAERAKFTPEDDSIILQSVSEIGLNWAKIANSLSKKTPLMVKNRYYYLKKKEGGNSSNAKQNSSSSPIAQPQSHQLLAAEIKAE